MSALASLAAGFLPVLLFLAGLGLLDSFKLVHRSTLAASLGAGAAAALLAWAAHHALLGAGLDADRLRLFVAPVTEECLKAAFVAWLVRTDRVGFMVDAAIAGFAVGAGFGLVENLYYAGALHDLSLGLWLVRGLGTAIMHGSATAMFAILARSLADRHDARGVWRLAPGLALAVAVHAGYNQVPFHPLLQAAALLAAMPLLLFAVFERSERATRAWLTTGFDDEVEALERLLEGDVRGTHVGRYLESLRAHFPPLVLADMLALLRVHLELSLRAKGLLIARAAGVAVEPDEHVRANLAELRYLERAIGVTGRLAVRPLRAARARERWQLTLLARELRRVAGAPPKDGA